MNGHWCSWAGGAAGGGGRSAQPSRAAGVGPYLDLAPWCGVFSLVEGLIVQLLTSNPKREKWAAGTQRVAVVGELGQQAARGGQHLKRVGVVLGDVDLDLGQVDLDLGQVAEIADNRGDSMG
jgi:hypothetical protein